MDKGTSCAIVSGSKYTVAGHSVLFHGLDNPFSNTKGGPIHNSTLPVCFLKFVAKRSCYSCLNRSVHYDIFVADFCAYACSCYRLLASCEITSCNLYLCDT